MLFMHVYMLFIQHAWQCNCQYVESQNPWEPSVTGTLRSSKWGMGMSQNQRILWIQEPIMDFSTLREMYLHITNLYHDRCVVIAIFSLFRHFQLWFRCPPCEKLRGWKCATTFIIIYRSLCKKRPSATVDGRNPAPVEVGSLSHYIFTVQRFFTSQVVSRVSEPSAVSALFHQHLNHEWFNAACPLRLFLAGASRRTMSFEAENSTEIGRMIWRVGRNSISHSIHGTAIFTYMNGWFLW